MRIHKNKYLARPVFVLLTLALWMGTSVQAMAQWNLLSGGSAGVSTATSSNVLIGTNEIPDFTNFIVKGISVFNPSMVQSAFHATATAEQVQQYTVWVNGWSMADRVNIATSVFPDYVFADDYKLASLYEVEQHYHQFGHLPGIRSRDEVLSQGSFQLDELALKLLEKVEELTLHTVQMDREIQSAMDQLQSLKSGSK